MSPLHIKSATYNGACAVCVRQVQSVNMDELSARVIGFIDNHGTDTFEGLALELFERQFEQNDPYRTYCQRIGTVPGNMPDWRDIPAVPTTAFRMFDLTCTSVPDCATVFYSSGTTAADHSKHWMSKSALLVYEHSLLAGYLQRAAPTREIWALMPDTVTAPHSSLSHMLKTVGASRWFWDTQHDLEAALDDAQRAGGGPITLFGTAFAFVDLFDRSTKRWVLPRESIVVETGGFKGRSREISKDQLYCLFRERLSVEDSVCYSEYGMCELASQFYGRGSAGSLRGPHWVKTRAIDPYSGEDAADGEPGLLRVYDLANVGSVLAIQTQDLVLRDAEGFVVLGRAPDAPLRGCSLSVEELWTHRS